MQTSRSCLSSYGGGWAAAVPDAAQWLQVDLKAAKQVVGVGWGSIQNL